MHGQEYAHELLHFFTKYVTDTDDDVQAVGRKTIVNTWRKAIILDW